VSADAAEARPPAGPAPVGAAGRSASAAPVIASHALVHSGGIEAYLMTLLRGLQARGLQPTVVTRRLDRGLPEAAQIDAITLSMAGIPGKLRDFVFDWRLQRLKRRRGWYPLIALNQTAAADIAVVGSNHPAHLAAMGKPPDGWLDRRKTALERRFQAGAQVVVAHSRLLARQSQQHHGIAPERIVVAYPPVDTARFSPVDAARRQALRRALDLPDDRCCFLLASTGHARKGLDLAVQALGHGPRPALLLVAGRPPGVSAPHLRYLGYRRDIEDVYRAVDATLMPSRYEPFGLVAVESVLCGTPVLPEAGTGCAEVIRPPAALPFRLDEPGAFDAAIDAALARWRAGTLRVDDPASALGYDPSVQAHLDVLLELVEQLRRDGPPHR
jgi:glycosyltransferase involved in cell wall biosynthesis